MHSQLFLTPPLFAQAAPARIVQHKTLRIDCEESDAELVRRARNGNRWAEEALYHRHVREVTRVVLRLLSRSSEAEDVVQDVFVLVLRDLHKLQNPDAFKSWLLRIAVNQVHRRFRRRKLLRLFGMDRGEDDVTLAAQVDPRAGPDVRATLVEIERLLSHLPARSRSAWILRHVEGQQLDEIALSIDCSRTTIKRLLAKAEDALREHVTYDSEGGGDV